MCRWLAVGAAEDCNVSWCLPGGPMAMLGGSRLHGSLGPACIIAYWCRALFALRLCRDDLVSPWRAGLFQVERGEMGFVEDSEAFSVPSAASGKRKLLSLLLKIKLQENGWPHPGPKAMLTLVRQRRFCTGGSGARVCSLGRQQLAGRQEQQRGLLRWACWPSEGSPMGWPGAPGPLWRRVREAAEELGVVV